MEANVVDHSSMWSLVSNASIVVQLVMLTLLAASVTSWVMIFQRSNLPLDLACTCFQFLFIADGM